MPARTRKAVQALLEEQLERVRATIGDAQREAAEHETSKRIALGAIKVLQNGAIEATREELESAGENELERRDAHRLQHLRDNRSKQRGAANPQERQPGPGAPDERASVDQNQHPGRPGKEESVFDFRAHGRTRGQLRAVEDGR